MEWRKGFCGWIFYFQPVLLWWYYNDKKAYRILAVLPFQMLAKHLAVMRAAMMEPGVHTMSDEIILQISCNIFLAFKWISMMTSGQNSHHNSKGADAVKPKSEVPHAGQKRQQCALSLQWRHNERSNVSNHQRLHYLLNCRFRCRSKKTS